MPVMDTLMIGLEKDVPSFCLILRLIKYSKFNSLSFVQSYVFTANFAVQAQFAFTTAMKKNHSSPVIVENIFDTQTPNHQNSSNKTINLVNFSIPIAIGIVDWCNKIISKVNQVENCWKALLSMISDHYDYFPRTLLKKNIYFGFFAISLISCTQPRRVQQTSVNPGNVEPVYAETASGMFTIKPGAERTRQYFHRLEGKKIGIVANQTSLIEGVHLVDSLLAMGFRVVKVYTPEHGFRGKAEAGELLDNEIDTKTGLPLISLYGDHRKPLPEDLEGIELMIFDLQDVGARFYTYISTLTLVMESCAENGIPLLVLDRPNPNGFYIDGPVLNPKYKSFIGMHSIPVVHGMTMAEYARMVNGEMWLKDSLQCELDWVEISGYNHKKRYNLPVRPSPNLPDMESIYLYPSLCFFEGTIVSVGRGTDYPFSIIGFPDYQQGPYRFTPESRPGASLKPPYLGVECTGYILRDRVSELKRNPGLRLEWLILMYQQYPDKDKFFTNFFEKLAGTDQLKKQIEAGLTEEEIKASWQEGLEAFQLIREKYLLYHDF